MGFGPAWRSTGGFLENLGTNGVNIVGLDAPGDSFKIKMEGDEAQLITNEKLTIESPGGTYRMLLDENGMKLKDTYIQMQAGNGSIRLYTNSTGIGVFSTTPVAQQSKQADLTPGVSDLAAVATFCNTLQERVGAYGWLA